MKYTAKDIRAALCLTQREVAIAAGLTERTVRLFECGNISPRASTKRQLADTYRVSPEQVDDLAQGKAIEWQGVAAEVSAVC